MKKLTLLAVFSLALLFPAAPGHVSASPILDTIMAQAVSNNPSAVKLQNLLRVKESIEQGNKNELVAIVTKAAAEKISDPDIFAAANAIAYGDNINDVVKNTMSQALERQVGAKLGKYQDGLVLINSLLRNSSLMPNTVKNNNTWPGAPGSYKTVLQMTATAYGPGYEDNGRWNDLTYMGGRVRKGVVAVDPKVIPLGSKVWVEGYGTAIAEDEGSAIVGNRIDLAFNTRQEALDYGIKPVKVYLLN